MNLEFRKENNMNIQEAIKLSLKTGKQFYRRKDEARVTFEVSKSNRCIDIYINGKKTSGWWNPRAIDLAAEDWEIH